MTMKHRIKHDLEKTLRMQRKQQQQQLQAKGSQNQQVVTTYNAIVSKSHSFLNELCREFRVEKTDLREDPTKICQTCGHIKCHCALRIG